MPNKEDYPDWFEFNNPPNIIGKPTAPWPRKGYKEVSKVTRINELHDYSLKEWGDMVGPIARFQLYSDDEGLYLNAYETEEVLNDNYDAEMVEYEKILAHYENQVVLDEARREEYKVLNKRYAEELVAEEESAVAITEKATLKKLLAKYGPQ